LEAIRRQIPVQFIQTQRLFSSETPSETSDVAELVANQPAVKKYAEELAGSINAKLAESAELSQSLDRSFPVRLVAEEAPAALSADELRNRLSELEKTRERLTAVGLLDKDGDSAFQIPPQIDESKRSVLSVYVNDVEKKLGVFDDMADRIELFKNIINRRFLYKQMTVNREKGFTFTTQDDRPLPSSALSSGEQHELVLLYELLFMVKPESLILIDEPELSLHIAWQERFLKDLQEIIKLTPMDFLIATHSPDIISDRWDLTVELRGPAQ
jgi:predicted ATP-binding protein involved in virulence